MEGRRQHDDALTQARYTRVAIATVAMTIGSVGVEVSPAHAASAVRGSAFGYYTHVSLFSGPSDLRGYGQPATVPAVALTPSVALPSTGGSVSLTDADGSMAAYGPAVIFGWYNTSIQTHGSSESETVMAPGSTSGAGTVISRSTVNNAGPRPLVMPQIVTTCQRSGSTTVATVQVSSGFVEKYDPNTGDATSTQAIPSNPTPGLTINGTLDHIGDSFSIVFNKPTTNADGSTTIEGAHMYLLGPTAVGDIMVASTTCGVTP